MFTVSGLGVIPKDQEISEKQYGSFVYFNFNLIAKDPYKEGRQWLKVSLQCPTDYIESAREKLVPGKALFIRIGELVGNKLESGYVAMTINTKWKWVEPIKALPGPEKKSYSDV